MARHGRQAGQGGHDQGLRQGAREIAASGEAAARFEFDLSDPGRPRLAAPPAAAGGAPSGGASPGEPGGAEARGSGGAGGWGFEPGADRAFSVAAATGNYLVELDFGPTSRSSAAEAAPAALLIEGRRVALASAREASGRVEIAANVRDASLLPPPPNAPGSGRVRLAPGEERSRAWDGRLTIEAAGAMPWPRTAALVPAPDMPTLFLAGDSTVADCEEGPYASWGQAFPALLRPTVAVANHARGGATLKSFAAELRLAKILECLKPGDWLLVQFGHNDQKAEWPQTYADPVGTFPAYLRTYIEEARLRGAIPVLATSPERLRFGPDGRILPSHGAYPDAVRALAAAEGLGLVDLERASRALYEALGPEGSMALLARPETGDLTHHGPCGAWELARCVARDLAAGADRRLAACLKPGAADFDPSRPGPPPAFAAAWPRAGAG